MPRGKATQRSRHVNGSARNWILAARASTHSMRIFTNFGPFSETLFFFCVCFFYSPLEICRRDSTRSSLAIDTHTPARTVFRPYLRGFYSACSLFIFISSEGHGKEKKEPRRMHPRGDRESAYNRCCSLNCCEFRGGE